MQGREVQGHPWVSGAGSAPSSGPSEDIPEAKESQSPGNWLLTLGGPGPSRVERRWRGPGPDPGLQGGQVALPGGAEALLHPLQFFLLLLLVFLLKATIAVLFFAYTDKVGLLQPRQARQLVGNLPMHSGPTGDRTMVPPPGKDCALLPLCRS